MASFTTAANVKAVLGIPTGTTRHDALINLHLAGIDQEMLDLVGQTGITSQVYSEVYDVPGPGENMIALRHWPATSIAALTDGGSLRAATDYYVDPESQSTVMLSGSGDFFTNGRQQVEITYTAGYSAIPGDLTMAASLLVAARINQGGIGGLESESASGYSKKAASGADAFLPPAVRSILARYRPLLR